MMNTKANIGSGNIFGEGVILGDQVVIGDNNRVGNYVTISGNVHIGSGNVVDNFVSIGGLPQHSRTKYEFDDKLPVGKILIGNSNVIREFTTINLPTLEKTEIKDSCYVMAHCHIAHDALLENNVILSNSCDLGGHTKILDGANLGKGVQVHPRTIVGQFSMIGMGSILIRHILPCTTVVGNPSHYIHVNSRGLERKGFTEEEINEIDRLISRKMTYLEFGPNNRKLRDCFDYFFSFLEKGRNVEVMPEIIMEPDK